MSDHGTVTAYITGGCRCDACRQAMAAYRAGDRAPTDKTHATVAAIETFVKTRGYPPTLAELGEVLGVSRSTARHHLNAAVEAKLVERASGVERGIIIKGDGR